jgi:hypothetical protein
MQKTCDEEKPDQIEDLLEASPNNLVKFLYQTGALSSS